jgi:hypothetical protein
MTPIIRRLFGCAAPLLYLSGLAEAEGALLTPFLPPTQAPQRKKPNHYGEKWVNRSRHLTLTTLKS